MRTHHNYHLTPYDVRTHKPGITSRETRNHRSFSHIHVEKVAAWSKCLHNVYGAKILSGRNSRKLLTCIRERRTAMIVKKKNASWRLAPLCGEDGICLNCIYHSQISLRNCAPLERCPNICAREFIYEVKRAQIIVMLR